MWCPTYTEVGRTTHVSQSVLFSAFDRMAWHHTRGKQQKDIKIINGTVFRVFPHPVLQACPKLALRSARHAHINTEDMLRSTHSARKSSKSHDGTLQQMLHLFHCHRRVWFLRKASPVAQYHGSLTKASCPPAHAPQHQQIVHYSTKKHIAINKLGATSADAARATQPRSSYLLHCSTRAWFP